jgi:hypothetical protein
MFLHQERDVLPCCSFFLLCLSQPTLAMIAVWHVWLAPGPVLLLMLL